MRTGPNASLAGMAYDEQLANEIRELLADQGAVTEKRMFGGLAFLLHGHMAVAASRRGGVLVRVNAAESADLVAASGVERMVMGGREMENWLYVDPNQVRTRRDLAAWVERGAAFAATLSPK